MRNFFSACFIAVSLICSYPIYAQQAGTSMEEPNIVNFILNKLDSLSNELEPLYKKALKGDMSHRKRLLELTGETHAVMQLIGLFGDSFTTEQLEQIQKNKEKFPQISEEEDEILTKGLASEMAENSIEIFGRMADLVPKQARLVLAGDNSYKEMLMFSVFDLIKQLNIIDLLELTDEQRNKMNAISSQFSQATYNGQQISFDLIFSLFRQNNAQSNNNAPENKTSNDSGIDELINNYEAILNESIPLIGKLKSGDKDAQQKYSDLLEKTQPLINSLTSSYERLTPEQKQRLQDIAEEYAIKANNLFNADNANLDGENQEDTVYECGVIIDKYESLIDKCIAILPKVAEKDQQAMEELQHMEKELKVVVEIISDCSSKFSAEETERVQKILAKLNNALTSGQ